MSETLDPMATVVDQQHLVEQLLTQAREQGADLIGPLDAEMTEHLGYVKHDPRTRTPRSIRRSSRSANAS